ncbi:hypothetical protein HDV05_004624 [Chytridiales sp. JEL 0842]|nr:hypothetical protein HDV05_004624 [Chytridiales sp. JEL 0842]
MNGADILDTYQTESEGRPSKDLIPVKDRRDSCAFVLQKRFYHATKLQFTNPANEKLYMSRRHISFTAYSKFALFSLGVLSICYSFLDPVTYCSAETKYRPDPLCKDIENGNALLLFRIVILSGLTFVGAIFTFFTKRTMLMPVLTQVVVAVCYWLHCFLLNWAAINVALGRSWYGFSGNLIKVQGNHQLANVFKAYVMNVVLIVINDSGMDPLIFGVMAALLFITTVTMYVVSGMMMWEILYYLTLLAISAVGINHLIGCEIDDRRQFALEVIFISEASRKQRALCEITERSNKEIFSAETIRQIHELTNDQNEIFTKPIYGAVQKTLNVVKSAVDETGIEKKVAETLRRSQKPLIKQPDGQPSGSGAVTAEVPLTGARKLPPLAKIAKPNVL